MMNTALRGKPDAGNPHVRFDEGEVAPAKPRRGSLLYKILHNRAFTMGASLVAVLTVNAAELSVSLPDDAKAWELSAAEDLRGYLSKRLGENPITVGGLAPIFHVGDTEFAKRHRLGCADLMDEEWVVQSFGRDVAINGGGTRGCLYAVSHFLEDDCGVRWWSVTEEDVPPPSPLAFAKLSRRGKPRFEYRDIFRDSKGSDADARFAIRRRLNRAGGDGNGLKIPMKYGGAYDYAPPHHCHTFDHYVPWAKLKDTKPELFALIDGKRSGGGDWNKGGQLCLTNPEVEARLREGLLKNAAESAAFAKARGWAVPRLFDVSMNDTERYCRCPKCEAEAAKYGQSGLLLRLLNRLADELVKVRPDAKLTTLAYFYTEAFPKGGVKANDNVIVKLCNTSSSLSTSIVKDPANRTFHDLVAGWGKYANNLFIWDYCITYGDYYGQTGMPFPNEDILAERYAFFAANNVKGVFTEHEQPDTSDFYELKYYLETRLLEDPNQDSRAMLRQACREYFGAEAGARVYAVRERMAKLAEVRRPFVRFFPAVEAFNYLHAEDIEFMRGEFAAAEQAAKGDAKATRRIKAARRSLDNLIAYRAKLNAARKGDDWEFLPAQIELHGEGNTITLVDDPKSPLGKTIRIDRLAQDFQFAFPINYYDYGAKKTTLVGWFMEVPIGGDYVLNDVGTIVPGESGRLAFSNKWGLQIPIMTPDLVGRHYVVRVSIRTDPRYLYIDKVILQHAAKADQTK